MEYAYSGVCSGVLPVFKTYISNIFSILEIGLSSWVSPDIGLIVYSSEISIWLVVDNLADYNYVAGEKMNSLGLKIFCLIAFFTLERTTRTDLHSDHLIPTPKLKFENFEKWEL